MYLSSVFAFYLKISWYLRLLRVCDTIINVLGSFPDEKITSKMWTTDNIVTFSSTKPYTAKYYLLLVFHSIQNVSIFFNFPCSFHIWVSILKMYVFCDYNKSSFLAWKRYIFISHVSIFRDLKRYLRCMLESENLVICYNLYSNLLYNTICSNQIKTNQKWSSEAARNFECCLSDWHFRLTQSSVVLISSTTSDGHYKLRLFYHLVKNLGRYRPLN